MNDDKFNDDDGEDMFVKPAPKKKADPAPAKKAASARKPAATTTRQSKLDFSQPTPRVVNGRSAAAKSKAQAVVIVSSSPSPTLERCHVADCWIER